MPAPSNSAASASRLLSSIPFLQSRLLTSLFEDIDLTGILNIMQNKCEQASMFSNLLQHDKVYMM